MTAFSGLVTVPPESFGLAFTLLGTLAGYIVGRYGGPREGEPKGGLKE